LTLQGSFAAIVATDDHPWMPTRDERARLRDLTARYWGSGLVLASFFPESERTPDLIADLAGAEARAASPGAVVRLLEMNERIDVRAVLPTLAVPTLVVHNRNDATVPFACGEYLAANIPGARLLALDHEGHINRDREASLGWMDALEELVTGAPPSAGPVDRVLSTVMFSDIVTSTEQLAALGDAAWKELLDRHDAIV
jgi:pimeloyl-ACP methyl ester carboxylesterase